jgi:hypothetical protein
LASFQTATWSEINAFREHIATEASKAHWLTDAAQSFSSALLKEFPSVVLARVFAVVPFERLPDLDAEIAQGFAEKVGAGPLLAPTTPVLSLLGTAGTDPSWNNRLFSSGHLAIPLLSKELVEGAPMLAQLLADLKLDLACLDDARPIDSNRMMGGINQRFYLQSAKTALDARGRLIIPARDFVTKHRIETVFGMAGAYVEGTIVAAIVFTSERLEAQVIDRYPSIIANFRMSTTAAVLSRRIYAPGTSFELPAS